MLPGDPGSAPSAPRSVEEQAGMVMDADEKISPLTFPVPSVSPEYVNIMASGLRSVGESISETGGSITGAWAGLSECYTAPESETLHAVLDPVATDGEDVAGGMATAATALEAFAEDVQSIKNSWSALTTKAHDLLRRIEAEGEDWRKSEGWGRGDNELVAENKLLIKEGQDLVNEYAEYEITCANALSKGIPGRTVFEETPEGGGDLDPNVFYHGYEQDLSELATEWGMSGASADHPWWIDAGDAVWDFGVGAVEGTGAMLGLHSSEGWFAQSWGDSLKEYHWDNLTSAAALVGMYDAETDSLGWTGGEGVKEAWKDLAHSVVPWEEWGDRPGYVIGTAALNIGAMVGGAVLTATGVGAVVGVPLMAWRGAAILDGMGSSGRGGSGTDVDLPKIPDMPTFGGSGAPMVPIDLNKLDTSGFSPEQMNEIRASLDRIAAEHPTGNDASAGGRPSQPRGDHNDPHRGQPGPASAGEAHPDGARAGDLDLFDQLINHPDNQRFAQQVSQNNAGEAARVDQAAKTNPRGPSGSDEGLWTISELGGDPRTREPATTAPRHDFGSAHAQSSGPSNDQYLRQNDIEGQSSDANRSGEGDPSAHTPIDRRGDGPQTRDHNPTASNSTNSSAPAGNNSPQDTPTSSRNGDETSTRNSHSETDLQGHNRDGTKDSYGKNGDSANDVASDRSTWAPDAARSPHRSGSEEAPSAQGEKHESGGSDNRERVRGNKLSPQERLDAAQKYLTGIKLNPPKDFVADFMDRLNGSGSLLDIFYNRTDGHRWSKETTIGSRTIPEIKWSEEFKKWTAKDPLPPPTKPDYLLPEKRVLFDRRDGHEHNHRLDEYALERKEAIKAHRDADSAHKDIKKLYKDDKHPLVIEADKARSLAHGKMARVSEDHGTEVTKSYIKDIFDGERTYDISKKNGGEGSMTLPKLEGENILESVFTAPGGGNLQFDLVYPTSDSGFVIAEAKGDKDTPLGERKIGEGDSRERISQGVTDYLRATFENMRARGNDDPRESELPLGSGYVNEADLADALQDALGEGRLYYAEMKGVSTSEGSHAGVKFGLFDVSSGEDINPHKKKDS